MGRTTLEGGPRPAARSFDFQEASSRKLRILRVSDRLEFQFSAMRLAKVAKIANFAVGAIANSQNSQNSQRSVLIFDFRGRVRAATWSRLSHDAPGFSNGLSVNHSGRPGMFLKPAVICEDIDRSLGRFLVSD